MSRWSVLEVIKGAKYKGGSVRTCKLRIRPRHVVVVLEKNEETGEFPLDLAEVANRGAEILDYRDAVQASQQEAEA